MVEMGDNIESRQEVLTEMKTFIEHECSEIGEILAQLSWTPDHILKKKSVVQCPNDPGHHLPESSLPRHVAVCSLRKKRLSAEQIETELQNNDAFYKNADLTGKVVLDEGLLNRILWDYSMEHRQVHMGHRSMPVGAEDWNVKLSAQERLAVYEHCVQKLKAEGKMPNVEKDEVLTTDWERIIKKGLLDQGAKPKSEVELLAMLRDQKRRRQSYRGKNVHITKKSYTEIIREVIMNQMEMMTGSEESSTVEGKETAESARDRVNHHRSPSPYHPRHGSRSPRRHHSPSRRSRRESTSPRRRRSQSRGRSSRRERSRSRRRSPARRKRSRSSSPYKKDRDTPRHRREGSSARDRGDSQTESQGLSLQQSSHQDYEEGQIESDDSSSQREHHRRSKKKSSKHKKHKHKKNKSKSFHSDSD